MPADSITASSVKRLTYNDKPKGKREAYREMDKVLQYFYSRGHITASIDSISEDSSRITAIFYAGPVYQTSAISQGNAGEVILGQSGFREKIYADRPFNINDIKRLHENILKYCENNGYPFASVRLDSIRISPDRKISASLNLKLNHLVTIDTVMVKGNSRLHRKFIRNYFNIRQGDIYNESRIRKVAGRLQDLPYVSVVRPHEVAFADDKASLILYIDKKRASQFDGILGIAPNEQVSGKLLLTGDIKLKLFSAFNRGELIDFNWRKLEASSQDLKFRFNFPFLFNTPFGIDYSLRLFKKDTSYLTLTNNIGLQVLFNGYNSVKAFFENQRSSLLSTYGLEFATTLPVYADITTSLYGLGLEYSRLNYRYNPRKGFRFDMAGAIGSKTLKENADINPELYEGVALNSTLYRLQLNADFFIPVFRKSTLLLANKSGFLENKNLFENELYRIGGLKTLRGFDEESIAASVYAIFSLEFRYLFDLNSYLHFFVDGAYYEQPTSLAYISDWPYGFGAGVNFETRAGIFSLTYALGQREGQPLQFKSAKIHFGLTAIF
jgi:outer membrane protein assembly factor BamA